jgi:hypothetical protein
MRRTFRCSDVNVNNQHRRIEFAARPRLINQMAMQFFVRHIPPQRLIIPHTTATKVD